MQLKQLYDTPPGWQKVLNKRLADGSLMVPGKPENDLLNPPPLIGVELWHTGKNEPQNFSDRLVDKYLAAGIVRFDDDGSLLMNVTHDGKPVVLRYTVKRRPGSYCMHCGEYIGDNSDVTGANSRAHVAEKHADAAPIPGHPAGYERIHHYECELAAEQHALYSFDRFDAKRKGRA